MFVCAFTAGYVCVCAFTAGYVSVCVYCMCVLCVCMQLRQEKVQLEQTLEQEQEQQIAKLTKKIERLEKETSGKQTSLDKVST